MRAQLRHIRPFLFCGISSFILFFTSCSVSRKIARTAHEYVLGAEVLKAAHVGISIFDPSANRYLYNHQGDKYFVPASNTKLPTCYAAMKYLGDSLVGLRYAIPDTWKRADKFFVIESTGDPTFLHPDYQTQPVFDFLTHAFAAKNTIFGYLSKANKVERWGNGWSWNDYEADYMAERSTFPIYGNFIRVRLLDTSARAVPAADYPWIPSSRLFSTGTRYFDSLLNSRYVFKGRSFGKKVYPEIELHREIGANTFSLKSADRPFRGQDFPFVTNDFSTAIDLLKDTLKFHLAFVFRNGTINGFLAESDEIDFYDFKINKWHTIHSQPTDSLLRPMMHRSDNFFAEQSLLMVSNERLGLMNDQQIIDTLLKTDFKDLPQAPRWADGSGLSRYNLFTPQDFVAILDKMRKEFGMERLKAILPTGGEGTIRSYYKSDSGYIYGKTGTLSGVVAFSGFLYTKKGKLLIFSTLINNHRGSAAEVRRAVEKFLQQLRADY